MEIIYKLIKKIQTRDGFYKYPKLSEHAFELSIQDIMPNEILVVGFVYKFLSPAFLLRIKKEYNIKLYLYDTDSCNLSAKRREFIFFLDQELPIYDEIFSFSNVTTRFLKETKQLNASFLPFGAKKVDQLIVNKFAHDVFFTGSCDLRRIFLLEGIKDKVTIYGARWSRNYPLISNELRRKVHDQSVWGDELTNLLMQSKIVLNITRSHFYGVETGVNLRIFEALAAGCFLLTDYCDELAEIFEIGEEVEVFRSSQELKDKVEYYLSHPKERLRIAQKGHEKFLANHTWDAKVRHLINRIS